MRIKSPLFTKAKGSIGHCTFSSGSQGTLLKARRKVNRSRTWLDIRFRKGLNVARALWETQKDSINSYWWNDYANNQPIYDWVGERVLGNVRRQFIYYHTIAYVFNLTDPFPYPPYFSSFTNVNINAFEADYANQKLYMHYHPYNWTGDPFDGGLVFYVGKPTLNIYDWDPWNMSGHMRNRFGTFRFSQYLPPVAGGYTFPIEIPNPWGGIPSDYNVIIGLRLVQDQRLWSRFCMYQTKLYVPYP